MLSVPVFRRDPRRHLRIALVLVSVVFYALLLGRLGFLITATLLLSILFAAFGVRRARILPLAAVVTLAIHFAFYTLLRVPLPWGLLEGIAW
jgi:putative tricarboxylic transport membrane protein